MSFYFDLQLFAETVVKPGEDIKVDIKPGDSVKISGGANFPGSMRFTNDSSAVLHFETLGGFPYAARWVGNPGVGGTFKWVTYTTNGKASATTSYQSLDNEGTIIKQTTQDRLKTIVGYATTDIDYSISAGLLGLPYKTVDVLGAEVKEIIKIRERVLSKNVVLTKITDLDFSKKGTSIAYYSLGRAENSHGGDANDSTKVTVDSVKEDSPDPGLKGIVIRKNGEPYFVANDQAYVKVTATTTDAGVTTLAVNVMRMKANGELVKSTEAWNGTLTLSGVKNSAATDYADKYAVLKYNKSSQAKWHLNVTDAAIGSAFTGLSKEDYIDTADTGNAAVTLKKGTYTIYNTLMKDNKAVGMETRTLTVAGTVDVKTNADGQVTSLTGLDKVGEKVTLKDGQTTTTYEYLGNGYLKTEITGSVKKAYKNVTAAAGADVLTLTDNSWIDYVAGTKTFDFSKTVGDKVLYFALNGKGASVNLKAVKTSMTSVGDKNYVALTVNEAGKVSNVKRVAFFGGETIKETSAKITGTLTMTALGKAMTFSRSEASALDAAATVKITGVAAGSSLVLSANDTITTARLKVNEKVTVNNVVFTAGAAGVLNIKAADGAAALVSGTVKLFGNKDNITAGSTVITSLSDSEITVTATAKGNFTIGQLDDGESFDVGGTIYTKAGKKLYIGTDADMRVYDMGNAKSISSAKLNVNNTRQWKAVAEADKAYGNAYIDLALADEARKSLTGDFSYVMDKYVIKGTKASKNAAVSGSVTDYQQVVGVVETNMADYKVKSSEGQTIKNYIGWSVTGGDGNDTIIGAVKGASRINAGAGENTIKLGKASEIITIGAGQDKIIGYTSGYDFINFGEGEEGEFYYQVKGNDVYLAKDKDAYEKGKYALVQGAANGKRMDVNKHGYYFGANVSGKNSNIFTYRNYEENYYIGSEELTAETTGRDTLKVTEQADSAYVDINLKDDKHFVSIDAVDARGMKAPKGTKAAEIDKYKGVNVTAAATGLRFTGSNFADTVTCGAGNDYIITGAKQGNDVIKDFGVGDVIQLNGLTSKDISKLQTLCNGNTKDMIFSFAKGGTISISSVEGTTLSFSKNKITATSATANNG